MDIVYYPEPVLYERSTPVDTIDDKLAETVREMFELMYKKRGVGLAANQVGIAKRFFVVNVEQGGPDDPPEERTKGERVFINPEILSADGEQRGEEGCLSIPGVMGNVTRADKITVRYQDLAGETHEIEAEGYLARAIQHENDHIDGKLFIDYLSTAEKAMAESRLKTLRKDFDARQKKKKAREAKAARKAGKGKKRARVRKD